MKTLLGNKQELRSEDVPLNSKEDLLMILSAVVYAQENGYKVEAEEGYYDVGNMILKSFKISEVTFNS